MAGSKIYITLDVDDKGSAVIKKFGGSTDRAFNKLKKNARAGARQAGKMERAWKKSINSLKRHWKAYAAVGVVAVYGVTKIISGAIAKMKEYVGLANIQEAAEKRLGAVVRATGQAAGFSAAQMFQMAAEMQKITTVGDEVSIAGMAILATFKRIQGEGFKRTMLVAADMSEVMQTDLKSSLVMIGKALNDPIANLSAMSRAGVQFTKDQKEQIKILWESGDVVGAQAIILKELESQFGGAAAAARETFGGSVIAAGNALGDMKEEMGFVITKNQFFISVIHLAEEQFIAWGKAIKNNQQYLAELVKEGVIRLLDSILAVIKVMRFFHNAWLGIKLVGTAAIHAIAVGLEELLGGIRFLFAPLDAIFEGLKKLKIIKVNPFDKAEESLGRFRASSLDVTKQVLQDIKKTNKTYDLVIDKIEDWQTQIKKIPVAQKEAEQAAEKVIEKLAPAPVDLKAMQERERMEKNVLECFKKARMTETELALYNLDKQFLRYDEFVKDKAALDAWYTERYKEITGKEEAERVKNRERMERNVLECFKKARMTETEIALYNLDKQFLRYDEFVKDKAALDAWYLERYKEIMGEKTSTTASAIEKWAEEVKDISESVEVMMTKVFDKVSAGIGTAVADAIMSGKNLAESMRALMSQVTHHIISTLVRIGTEKLIQAAILRRAAIKEALASIAASAAKAFGAAYAAIATIPIVGPVLAPAAAAAAGVAVFAGGKALLGQAHGGLTYAREDATYEIQRGERVLTREQNKDLQKFMKQGNAPMFNINISTIDAQSFEERLSQHPDVFEGAIVNAVMKSKTIRHVMRRY